MKLIHHTIVYTQKMGTKERSMERYCGTWHHIITKLKKRIGEGSTLTIQNSWKHVWLTVLGDLNFTTFWKGKTIKTDKRVVAVRDWRRRVEMGRWNHVPFQDGEAVLHNTITVDLSLYSCQSQRTYSPDSELSQAWTEMDYSGILFLISFLQI